MVGYGEMVFFVGGVELILLVGDILVVVAVIFCVLEYIGLAGDVFCFVLHEVQLSNVIVNL